MRIKMVVEYDGTDFHGFQRQKGLRTVDQTLEEAILSLTGGSIKVIGSGRTDAGVHALGQVVAFDTQTTIPAERFAVALNSLLPRDVQVLTSEQAADGFHPRYDAISKTYRYVVYRSPAGYTLKRRYAYGYYRELDLSAIKAAVRRLEGEHDFRGFMASGSAVKNTVRTIRQLAVAENGPDLIFEVVANGFLYHMVRNLVGTLLEIGRGSLDVQSIDRIINSGDRRLAGPTVPACGLCLVKVDF